MRVYLEKRRVVLQVWLVLALGGVVMAAGCRKQEGDPWAKMRDAMVRQQVELRGIRNPSVLAAIRSVPRHLFVPLQARKHAYDDSPQVIGSGQTISQPYIVALMTELLEIQPGDRVLEIGTGSGYQAAVLSAMGIEVYSMEIRPDLCRQAQETLGNLGYVNVHVRCGDGYGGWPEVAPFDGIVVTAAPERIPEPLIEQLREGAHMVIPVGSFYQELKVITKEGEGTTDRSVIPVRFVPMTGEIEAREESMD